MTSYRRALMCPRGWMPHPRLMDNWDWFSWTWAAIGHHMYGCCD